MSTQITTAMVNQYGANVQFLAQQKGSRFRAYVRQEMQHSLAEYFDQVGVAVAQQKTTRNSDTPLMNTPHARRQVTMTDWEYADLIDRQDRIRTIIDPTNPYAVAAGWALGRSMDDQIIANALGTAYTGQTGSTAVTHPNSQKYASNDGSAFQNLTVEDLIEVKEMFDAADVDESIPRYLAYTHSQLASILGTTQVTSSLYTNVKALVEGKVDTFLGFKFIRSERLLTYPTGSGVTASPTTGAVGSGSSVDGFRRCIAWAHDGLILTTGIDINVDIGPRRDKSNATQVYACMSIGASRMEEVKVVEIICDEAA